VAGVGGGESTTSRLEPRSNHVGLARIQRALVALGVFARPWWRRHVGIGHHDTVAFKAVGPYHSPTEKDYLLAVLELNKLEDPLVVSNRGWHRGPKAQVQGEVRIELRGGEELSKLVARHSPVRVWEEG